MAAGVPQASLIAFAILILGIIQIGPTIVIVPVIFWSWTAMETGSALLFTAYMIPVNLIDNILRPIVMGRGLKTPMLVILVGVIGGTLAYGITGLFLGPIVLAVIWELLAAWIKERDMLDKLLRVRSGLLSGILLLISQVPRCRRHNHPAPRLSMCLKCWRRP